MNFPGWTPQELLDIYHCRFEENRDDDKYSYHYNLERKYLIALATNPEMEKVWERLLKSRRYVPADDISKSRGDDAMVLSLHHYVVNAIHKLDRKFSTVNDDVLECQEIAKAARLLAAKLHNRSLDHSPLHWFPDEAINTMLARDINPDKASGYFCLIRDESEFHKKGGIYSEVRFTDKDSGKIVSEYWNVANSTNEFFNKFMITPQFPRLSEILKSLASDADEATRKEVKRPRIAKNKDTSDATKFIRALYPFWIETFGTPLYKTFAALCRVVLDGCQVRESSVKDALRWHKKKKG
jgi:hypothetical protein